jgi:hypothetical protein
MPQETPSPRSSKAATIERHSARAQGLPSSYVAPATEGSHTLYLQQAHSAIHVAAHRRPTIV